MPASIGAGARIYMGDAATPNPNWNALNASQLAAYDVTGKLDSFNISLKEGTVDITKLNADTYDFFRHHIAGLSDADASCNYGEDDTGGAFIRRLLAIKRGKLHPKGRGKVDFLVRKFGDGTGNIQCKMTGSFPNIGINIALEDEIGGDLQVKIDGAPVFEQQA